MQHSEAPAQESTASEIWGASRPAWPSHPELGAWDSLPLGFFLVSCLASLAAAILLSGFSLSLNSFLLAVCFGLSLPFLAHQAHHFGLLSPGFLLGLAFVYVNLIIPLEIEIDPQLPASFCAVVPFVSRSALEQPLIATTFGLVGMLVGYAMGVAPHQGVAQQYWERPPSPERLRRAGWILVGIGGGLFFFGVTLATGSPFGLYSVSYTERVEVTAEIGTLGNGLNLLYTGAMIVVSATFGDRKQRNTLQAWILLVAFGLHSVLAGAKVHIFLVGISALTAHQLSLSSEKRLGAASLGLLGAAAAIVAVMLAINPMRTRLGLGLGEMMDFVAEETDIQYLNPANLDAYGPYTTLYTVTNDTVLKGPELGRSYANAFLLALPGQIVKERDPAIHQRFASIYMHDDAPETASFAFAAVAEGYLNFGYLGAAFQLGLLGWLAGAVSRILRVGRFSLRVIVLAAFAAPWLATAVRTNFDSLLREVVLLMTVPLLVADWASLEESRPKPP